MPALRGGGGPAGLAAALAAPAAAAARWAAVLGVTWAANGTAAGIELAGWGQRLRFEPARPGQGEGITAVSVAGLPAGQAAQVIGGVRFTGEGGL